METRKLESRNPKSIFCGENIYSSAVEEKLHKLETIYSSIIDKKIIGKDTIRLTRDELYKIKKFLIVDGLRTMFEEGQFVKFFKTFEPSAKEYFKRLELTAKVDPREAIYLKMLNKNNHKYLSKIDMTDKEKYMFCLERLLDNEPFALHLTDCPMDLIAWSAAFTESYLTFWDAAESEEFLLTDINMMSEYDMCHEMYGGLNTEKTSYLISKINESSIYLSILKTLSVMYENYDIFNISNTRCIVCINPFFKLYDDNIFGVDNQNIISKPNIWPGTTIHHLKAYEIPKNEYEKSTLEYTKNDIFIYNPYKLTVEETLALNLKFIKQCKNALGFVNKEKIINSLGYANVAFACYDAAHAHVNEKEPYAGLSAFTKSIMNNMFYPVFKQLCDEGYKANINPLNIFDKEGILSHLGMRTNYYMDEYIINQLRNNPNIDLSPFEVLKKQNAEEIIRIFECEAKIAYELNSEYMDSLYSDKLDVYYSRNVK